MSIPSSVVLPGPVLLVGEGHGDIGALLAWAFVEQGVQVIAYCSRYHLLAYVTGARHLRPSLSLSPQEDLRRILAAERPSIVIPCGDVAARMLHALWRAAPETRELLERSLGDPAYFDIVSSRSAFFQWVGQWEDLLQPEGRVLDGERESACPPAACFPVVLKAEGSSAGSGVRVANSDDELRHAYRQLTAPRDEAARPSSFRMPYRRLRAWLFDLSCDREAAHRRSIVMQQYHPGADATCSIFCIKGEVVAHLSLKVLATHRERGPSVVVERIAHAGMLDAVTKLASRMGLSGFHGFDFILDQQERAWLLEINPRLTGTAHMACGAGHDLVQACLQAIVPAAMRPQIVERPALPGTRWGHFHQRYAGLAMSHVGAFHLDVPRGDARLMRAVRRRLAGKDWPAVLRRFGGLAAKFRRMPRAGSPQGIAG